MIIPTRKLRNGFEIPVYGLGTWQMGGGWTMDTEDDASDIAAIKNAIDLGITHIDTAEVYGGGHTEELVGEAIKDFDRKKLFIVSKVYTDHLSYGDVLKSAKNSLKRLKTSYLDLYLTHGYNQKISIKETMGAMDTLVDEELVRNIGFCNYTVSDIQEAQSYAKHKLVAGQMHYNLQIREVEKKKILSYCQHNDIMLIAWRPVQGALVNNRQQIIKDLMEKYNKTASQIAINWLISQKNVVTLSKTSNIEHLKENLGAIGLNMENEDIERLRTEYPDQRNASDALPLS